MFEAYTYEKILGDLLAQAPSGVDTREGSIFFDAISGTAIRMAKLYTDLDLVFFLTQIQTTTGDELDIKASENGITRHAATPAEYYVTFTGALPDVGERFFYDGIYFVLREDSENVMYLQCEQSGAAYNFISFGTAVVPVNNIEGLTAATIGAVIDGDNETLYSHGTDEETDESLRSRIQAKISGPAENGNKQHYKLWCEEADDKVGIARITPLWNGPNTVKAVLIDPDGKPCDADTVANVQDYVDPANLGYTVTRDGVTYVVGDGLGEGVANLGAHFTAAPAQAVEIDITADIELASGYDAQTATDDAEAAIEEFFKRLVLDTESADDIVVRLSAVGAVLSGLPDILDYSNLKINGGTANITPGADGVPVLGEVTFSAV